MLKLDTGDLPSALLEAEKGRKETQAIDAIRNWRFRLLEAEVFLWQGKAKDCLTLLDSPPLAVTTSEELNAKTKLAQGRALYSLYDPAAQSYLREAEELANAKLPNLLGEVALAQGGMQYQNGEYTAARRSFQQALNLSRKYSQPLLEAKAAGSLGRLFTRIGHYDESLDYSLRALEISQSANAHHIEAAVRLNIGWNYLELGDFEQAIPFFEASEVLAATAGLTKIQQEDLNSLGRIRFNQSRFEEADGLYHRALQSARSLQDGPSIAVYLDNLALVAGNRGKLDEADKYNRDALDVQHNANDRIEKLKCLLTSAWIADGRQEFGTAKPLLQTIIHDKATPKPLQWEAEDELARLYVARNQIREAKAQFQKVLQTLDSARSSIYQDQNRLAFSSREADIYTNYIRFLLNQNDLVKAIQVSELMRARTLEEALGSTGGRQLLLTAVQRFLRTHEQVILAYWLAPDVSYLWVITPSQIKPFQLPPKQEIDAKVERYQKSVTTLGDVEHTHAGGRELYRILVEPARKLIPTKAHVVIIPDGSLGKLNFETLLVPEPSPHFWIDDVQVAEASSIALLIRSRSNQVTNRKLLAIGDPVQVTDDYKRLAYAHQEIEAAAEHFPANQRKIVSGPDATPSSYALNQPGQFDVIHFATHGFASEASPLDSAIILSPQADKSFKLYARDIVKIPLKADMVTISACYGAGKRTYSAEGLVGLAWAFLRAGAHQVIAGLWNVEDQPTPELMRSFYTELASGKSAAVALRDAKLKMLHSTGVYRRPYYWAALQLYIGS